MLRNVTSPLGVSILAKDGNIGRRVLLSLTIFLQPDWDQRVLPVDLTIEEVRHRPDVDTDLPVYRQQEVSMAQHYGWPAYWTIETPLLKETNEPEGIRTLGAPMKF